MTRAPQRTCASLVCVRQADQEAVPRAQLGVSPGPQPRQPRGRGNVCAHRQGLPSVRGAELGSAAAKAWVWLWSLTLGVGSCFGVCVLRGGGGLPGARITDEDTRRNWEEYGNPDGPMERSYGIALPSWIVSQENKYMVLLVYSVVLLVVIPLVVVSRVDPRPLRPCTSVQSTAPWCSPTSGIAASGSSRTKSCKTPSSSTSSA